MRALLPALLLPCALLCACATLTPPADWVELPKAPGRDFGAVSSRGVRLAVRRHDNPSGGNLAFWVEAARRELIEGKGYTLLETNEVTAESGSRGTELLFAADRELRPHLYLVTIFILGSGPFGWFGTDVVTVEAGGDEPLVRPDLPAIRASVRTVR